MYMYTVNVVIFAGGKFRENLSREGYFLDYAPISLIKSYRFYFRVGEIYAMRATLQKTQKLPPRENFHVYSILYDQ